jgi:drug/metabolite transporter (DMT)-like permease
MRIGILCALVAGIMWGLVFVGPLMLSDYPPALLAMGRYLAFGLIVLPMAWFDRLALRDLGRADWLEALKLAAIGNLLYYICLASALQRAGGPLPTMIIGTLPVVISISANLRDSKRDGLLPWRQLLPGLALIVAGIACVNQVEITALQTTGPDDIWRYASGAALAIAGVICWTWYPLRNADWLRAHADRSPRIWATAQGLMTLPLAAFGYALIWAYISVARIDFAMPFGPRPLYFIGLMAAIGFFASWAGTWFWNEAGKRLPSALAGQLIVFETLAALAYNYILRGHWPEPLTIAGIILLMMGVLSAARIKPQAVQG